jgi:uncharacterized protein
MNAQQNKNLNSLIERYGSAPDFFDQNITDVNSRTSYGDQLIHAAAVSGNLDDIVFLLEVGADIDSKGDSGQTPLHYAAEQGHIEVVRFLLRNGADRTIKNSDEETAYDIAELLNEKNIQEELSKPKGASPVKL